MVAALLTLAVTAALTLYAYTTDSDFTMCGGALFIFGAALLVLGLLTMIFQCEFLHMLYVCGCTILYGFYLIYDT